MVDNKDKESCCGCSACMAACPVNAIIMNTDNTGFLYPKIDTVTCINCNLCERICPTSREIESISYKEIYAIKNKQEEIRNQSSSGGLFSIFATNTIDKGGVVYGTVFDDNWNVVHARIKDRKDVQKLRGSKYVQSDMKNIYKEVKTDLLNGTEVLFSGTPCQIAGLLSFLKRKYDNLTTVDFVCHGVPNPRIWKDYLKEVVAARRAAAGKSSVLSSLNFLSSIKDIKFRDKSNGWEKFRFVIEFAEASAEGKKSTILSSIDEYHRENDYMRLFLDDFINRPSCFKCHFREGRSGADYTIGDYWGIQNCYPDFYDEKGVSLLMTKQVLPSFINDNCHYIQTTFDDAKSGNRAICYDWQRNPHSELFYIIHDVFHLSVKSSLKITIKIKDTSTIITKIRKRIKQLLVDFFHAKFQSQLR